MLRGLGTLWWLEMKIFLREPLGVVATLVVPVAVFVLLGRSLGGDGEAPPVGDVDLLRLEVPVFAILLVILSAVVSVVAIISIYREGGILKRLHATPLRPFTIFAAHVLVKLSLTAATLGLMAAAGRRYYPTTLDVPVVGVGLAVVFTTAMLLSIGFLVASLVPTARFAQPLASLVLYPMLGISGLFVPLAELPSTVQAVARVLPLTYAASLLKGIWGGASWLDHAGDVAALVAVFVVCTTISSRVFRWE